MINSENDKNNSGSDNVIIIIKKILFLAICLGGITNILEKMGMYNIILFGINPLTFLMSLPFAIRLFIVFLNYLFIISIVILPFYILYKFTFETYSRLRRAKLKCQKCGEEDALRLYSYTIYTNRPIAPFYNPTSTRKYPRMMTRRDYPDRRFFVNKCCFCGHETVWFYKEFTQPDDPVENLHPLDIWAREHYISPAMVREKCLYNNEVHTIQHCGKCDTRHDGDICPNCDYWKCTHCEKSNTNNVSNCAYCYTGRPTGYGL